MGQLEKEWQDSAGPPGPVRGRKRPDSPLELGALGLGSEPGSWAGRAGVPDCHPLQGVQRENIAEESDGGGLLASDSCWTGRPGPVEPSPIGYSSLHWPSFFSSTCHSHRHLFASHSASAEHLCYPFCCLVQPAVSVSLQTPPLSQPLCPLSALSSLLFLFLCSPHSCPTPPCLFILCLSTPFLSPSSLSLIIENSRTGEEPGRTQRAGQPFLSGLALRLLS